MSKSIDRRFVFQQMGGVEYEPTPDDVRAIVNKSSGADWLFFRDQNVFAYRPNLLIRMEPEEKGLSGRFQLLYGTYPVGSVHVVVDETRKAADDTLDASLKGDVEVYLRGFKVAEVEAEWLSTP